MGRGLLSNIDKSEFKKIRMSVSNNKLTTETLKRSIDDVWKIRASVHKNPGFSANAICSEVVQASEDNYAIHLPVRCKEYDRQLLFEANLDSVDTQQKGDVRKVWMDEHSGICNYTVVNKGQPIIEYPINIEEDSRKVFLQTNSDSKESQFHQKRSGKCIELNEYDAIHQSVGCEEDLRKVFFATDMETKNTQIQQKDDVREVWIELSRSTKVNGNQSIYVWPVTYVQHTREVFFEATTESREVQW